MELTRVKNALPNTCRQPLADSSRMAADTGGLVTHSARHWQTCHLIYLFGHLLMHAPIVVVCDEY